MQKFFKAIAKVFFFTILYCSSVYGADITGSGNEVTGTSTTQQNIAGNNTEVTVKSSATLTRTNSTIKTNTHLNATIVVESGATVTSTSSNAIQAIDAGKGLEIKNSGTIKAGSSKAINLTDVEEGTLTNNSGGIIQANTNTISMLETTGDVTNDITIHNYGTIFATDTGNATTNTIKSDKNSTNITIHNYKGGHIYHTSSTAVVVLGGSTTFTNSGKVENKDGPAQNAITMTTTEGTTGATLNLKDGGIIIGKINITESGHTIKVNHGMGQSYYYDTTGGGSYDLEDLDGNIIVKGSVGSVGQGGNEILDELLGQKSINLRKSITKFKRSDQYLNQSESWSEVFSSFEKRQGKKNTLRLEHNNLRAGANIIQPGENSNQIFLIETGRQEFSKDHNIDRLSISGGFLLDEKQSKFNSNSETFFLLGLTYNNSNRRILTNTTTSGLFDIEDDYFSYDALLGTKFLNDTIPDFSYSIGYSLTPKHDESLYYKWEKKDFINASVALSDEYLILSDDKSKLYFSWLTDYREVIAENSQEFRINNALAEYNQHDDLSSEITVTAGIDYEFQPLEHSLFSINLDGLYSSQETYGAQAKLYYKSIF